MILHTGGEACGATSTRSRSISRAIASASGNVLIPSCLPSGSTSRTSRARIRSLIRCSSVVGKAVIRHHSLGSENKKDGRWKATPASVAAIQPGAHRWPGGGAQAPLSEQVVCRRVHPMSSLWTPGGEHPVGQGGQGGGRGGGRGGSRGDRGAD